MPRQGGGRESSDSLIQMVLFRTPQMRKGRKCQPGERQEEEKTGDHKINTRP